VNNICELYTRNSSLIIFMRLYSRGQSSSRAFDSYMLKNVAKEVVNMNRQLINNMKSWARTYFSFFRKILSNAINIRK